MNPITYDLLLTACRPGGASVLTSSTHLAPAGGAHSAIAPAKFVSGNTSVYGFEKRFVSEDQDAVDVVVVDSKQSVLNRIENALDEAIKDDHPVLRRTPRIEVTYDDVVESDLTLPHRAFDAHIRAGTVEGSPVTADPRYRAARDATPADARALLETSPVSLVFGSWDSTRRTHQVRQRSCLVGEIIGVLADQTGGTVSNPPRRGGARVDPVAMSVQQNKPGIEKLLEMLEDELSPKLVAKIRKKANRAKDTPVSLSELGLGGIPPSLDQLGGVACTDIIRTHVLSFSSLRQLRFGAGPEGDAACRALLAALALDGLARSDSELLLRANCDLVEAGPADVTLDQRYGQTAQVRALTIDEADELLSTAIDQAVDLAGITWNGVSLRVTGNPMIREGLVNGHDEEQA